MIKDGEIIMKSIKFIHCADLHLDSPFVGLKNLPANIYEKTKCSTFASFSKIVEVAIREQVDFVIIAGDLYDGEDRSIRAQLFLRKEFERLDQEGIAVFLVHGNHDHLSGSWTKLKWPKNVYQFPTTVEVIPYETRNKIRIHFYGFSYPKKNVSERMIEHYQKRDGADYHIGILHGHDSNNLAHYRYAPFKVRELIEKDFDYWALGHIHKSQILHKEPMIVYPGNIQGRHKNETGVKGCYLIEMDHFETRWKFIETAPIRWKTLELTAKEPFRCFDDFYQTIIGIKDDWRQKGTNVFFQINLNENQFDVSMTDRIDLEDMLQLLQEGEEQQDCFIWIYQLDIQKNETNGQVISNEFFQELSKQFRHVDIKEPLSFLFDHPKAKKYLAPLTEEEQHHILHEAEKLLFRLLKG